MNQAASVRLARANTRLSTGHNGGWANRAGVHSHRSFSAPVAGNHFGAASHAINGNLSLNRSTTGYGNRTFNSNSSTYGYGDSGYGYGNTGYGYGNGGYGYGNAGHGFRSSNLVQVYLPGFGWVLVPRRAIIY